jgi:hypothetical protein
MRAEPAPRSFHAFHASRAARMIATQPKAAMGKMMMAGITADIGFVHLFMTGLGAQYQVAWLRAGAASHKARRRAAAVGGFVGGVTGVSRLKLRLKASCLGTSSQ